MRKLSNVTLVAVDTLDADRLLWPLMKCVKDIEFGKVKVITSKKWVGWSKKKFPTFVEFVEIPPFDGVFDYSWFMIKNLFDHIDTDFCLIFQHDGWVVNPDAWTDEFFEHDYIGAPWYWLRDPKFRSDGKVYTGNIVGNGGFSFRSRRLCKALKDLPNVTFDSCHPEDGYVCTVYDKELRESHGIKFAPEELASRFSVENCEKYNNQFGHHNNKEMMLNLRGFNNFILNN